MDMLVFFFFFFFEWANKNLEKMNKITNFVINLPKIMENAKKFQKIILISLKLVYKLQIKKF